MMTKMYTTVEAIKQELDIDPSNTGNDSYIERKIRSYSALFDSLTGRSLAYQESIEERVSQPPSRRLMILSHTPIEGIEKIINPQGVEVDSDAYFIERDTSGLIARESGVWVHTAASTSNISRSPKVQPVASYQVIYSGGWVTPQQADDDPSLTADLPFDIEDCVIEAVASSYHDKGRDKSVASVSVGDASTSFNTDNRDVPEYFKKVAKRYKRTGVA